MLERALSSLHVSTTTSPPPSLPLSSATIFTTDTLDGWLQPESSLAKGLMVKRPSNGRWDACQPFIDEAIKRFGRSRGISTQCLNGDPAHLREQVGIILEKAALPAELSEQISCDACNLGAALGSLCSYSRVLEIKLEVCASLSPSTSPPSSCTRVLASAQLPCTAVQVFGENACNRWHRDNYGGRAIVSYTGAIGTQYTSDENVDFWELEHCGVNEHIIHDVSQIYAAEVGDLFFMKGMQYPAGAKGLIHKSPEVRFHADGRVVNRLVLKLDVPRE